MSCYLFTCMSLYIYTGSIFFLIMKKKQIYEKCISWKKTNLFLKALISQLSNCIWEKYQPDNLNFWVFINIKSGKRIMI